MNPVNLVFTYYDQPRMLQRQLELFKTYSPGWRIIIVDDGSPKHHAVDVIRVMPIHDLQVYRVEQDIPWNMTGARNLGCSQCDGWIYVSDIDTLLPAAEAIRLFASPASGKFYLPSRVDDAGGRPRITNVVNLLFERSAFDLIGGYDEDYAGGYGREEHDFLARLSMAAQCVRRKDVAVRSVPSWRIRDASVTGLSRDWKRNTELFRAKRAAGFPTPAPGLRFDWERIY